MDPNDLNRAGRPSGRTIVMSESEIVAECRRLGLPRPPTLPNAGPGDEVSDADASGGMTRSDVTETPWLRDVMTTLGSPLAVVFAHRQETGLVAEIGIFAVSSPWAVEQVAQPGSVYSLSPFSARDVLDRVLGYCRLSERSTVDTGACDLSGRGFLMAMDSAVADPDRCFRLLRADGLGMTAARTLVEVLAACVRRVQVTVVHRTDAGRIEGSNAAWLDAGVKGLWSVGAPTLASSGDYGDYGDALIERTTVTLAPTTRSRIIDEIIQGFPDGC